MQLQHVNVRLYVSGSADLTPLIPIFHNWIQGSVFEELLLDVADYRHVPAGPGVVLIGHQGDYSVDNTGGRLAIRYNRKTVLDGSNADRLRQATHSALLAADRLGADPRLGGQLRFGGRELQFSLNDRLLAPNTAATFDSARPDLDAFLKTLFGGSAYTLSQEGGDPRRLFAVSVTSAKPFSVAELLANLAA